MTDDRFLPGLPAGPLIDTNVHLSRWPFRRLPYDDTPSLLQHLKRRGIVHALTGSFDAILHRDLQGVNARLLKECATAGDERLIPVGTVHPGLPGWESDLEFCLAAPPMPGIRLYPGYHHYALNDPRFLMICDACAERGKLLQIVMRMEDPRTQHPDVQAEAVDPAPLLSLLPERPALQVMLLNAGQELHSPQAGELARAGQVSFEISHIEGTGGIAKFLQHVPVERLLFGSHFPFFYLEAALLKLHENDLGDHRTRLVASGNAARLLGDAKR